MNFWLLLFVIDLILFILTAATVVYMTIFAIAAYFHKRPAIPKSKRQNRFIILIPAYKKDDTIIRAVKSVLSQTYPQRLFDVTVISDHEDELTNFRLAQLPITLLTPNFKKSSKGKSLQLAIHNLPQFKIYDVVLILDADNIVLPEFLEELNNAYEYAGTKAIQVHRLSQNRDTPMAIIDATFEEIHNVIFRLGHTSTGLSSALAGSGMAFDFKWFKENIYKTKTSHEDKELEALLLKDHIFIDYFSNIYVFDEKTREPYDFMRQRKRWITGQYQAALNNMRFLPKALINKQYDFVDKVAQWLLIPRSILLGITILMSIVLPFVYFTLVVKWWILFAYTLFLFASLTPDYLVDKQWSLAFIKAPLLLFKKRQ